MCVCFVLSAKLRLKMFAKRPGGSPEQWETKDVLKWIQENDDSKDKIRKAVLIVVRDNDLDGHTLRQLADEKDEIQELFPALKERLAFKSLLRKMFKDDSTTTLQSTSEQTNIPKKLVMSPRVSQPIPVNLIRSPKSFAATPTTPCRPQDACISGPPSTPPLPHLRNRVTTLLQSMQPGRLPQAQRHTEKRPRPPYLEIKSNILSDVDTLQRQNDVAPSLPRLQHHGNPGIRNSTVSVSSPVQQNNTPVGPNRLTASSTSTLAYFTQPEIGPKAKRQAVEIVCHSVVSPTRSIPSTASYPPPVTSEVSSLILAMQDPPKETTSSPQITSVTSLAPVGGATAEDQTRPGLDSRQICKLGTRDLPDHTQTSPIIYISRSKLVNRIPIGYPAPLPSFSEEVQRLLAASITTAKGSIISVAARRKVVKECAQFYMTITNGNKLNSSDYANIGRTMIEQHPELECDSGAGMPWASFNKNLSQSIRNLRRRCKAKKNVSLSKTEGGVEVLKLLDDDSVVISDDDEEDVEEIVEETAEETIQESDDDEGEDEPVIHIKEEKPT